MLSVIIPAYNEEKYIEKTLKSIKAQTFKDYEIIVVANGCSDNTAKIAKKYTDKIFTVNEANVSLARNIGASKSKGDKLVFVDADTRLAENALEKIEKQFNRAVGTLITHVNTDFLIYKAIFEIKNFLHKTGLYHGSSGVIIVQNDLFKKVGGFETNLHIRENHNVISKLNKLDSYMVVKGTYAVTSSRRYDTWGIGKVTRFWLKNRWKANKVKDYEAVR